jgi:peptidoglycan/LPS O-acetylase OafA/YrhL
MSVLIGHSLYIAPDWFKNIFSKVIFLDGVTIFFVLSGFLIGNILIKSFNKEGITSKTVIKFWRNRWLRTLPPYFFILTVLIFSTYVLRVNHCGWAPFPTKKEVLHYFFFLQNFNWPAFNFFLESWSLAVEEWFYLLTPIVIIIIKKIFCLKINQTFLITIFLFLIVSIFVRYLRYSHFPELDFDNYFRKQVIVRFDSMMIGVFAAYISYYLKDFWEGKKYYLFVVGIFLFFLPHITGLSAIKPYLYIWSFSIESLAYFCFLPLLHSIKTVKGTIAKSITYISLISYSLYLLHFSLILLTIIGHYLFSYDDTVKWILYWILVFSLGTIMYLFIERPSMNLRKKFH